MAEGDNTRLTEAQTREKLRLARTTLLLQLGEASTELASLALDVARHSQAGTLKVGNKRGALTAMHATMSHLLVLIEYIDHLDMGGINRSTDIRQEVQRRYEGGLRQTERSLTDMSAQVQRLAQTAAQCRAVGQPLPFGEKIRARLVSEFARMMKDLSVIGLEQQVGTKPRPTGKPSRS